MKSVTKEQYKQENKKALKMHKIAEKVTILKIVIFFVT